MVCYFDSRRPQQVQELLQASLDAVTSFSNETKFPEGLRHRRSPAGTVLALEPSLRGRQPYHLRPGLWIKIGPSDPKDRRDLWPMVGVGLAHENTFLRLLWLKSLDIGVSIHCWASLFH